MEFFKQTFISLFCSMVICSMLILLGAPAESVVLGGFTIIVLTMGKGVYGHFKERINRKMSPFL